MRDQDRFSIVRRAVDIVTELATFPRLTARRSFRLLDYVQLQLAIAIYVQSQLQLRLNSNSRSNNQN